MDPFTIFAIASAVFGGASVIEQSKANRRSRNAAEAQRRMDNLRFAKERRASIRDTRMAQAAAMQAAENQGVGTSSGAYGGQGSILTQGNANLAFLDQQKSLADLTAKWLDSAAKAEGQAQMFGGLSQIASAGMNFFTPTAPAAKPVQSAASQRGFSNARTTTRGMASYNSIFGR